MQNHSNQMIAKNQNSSRANQNMLGYYLPRRDSACISTKYLLGVMNKQFKCPKRDTFKAGLQTVKNCTKIDLYSEIFALGLGELGFDIAKLPDKQWRVHTTLPGFPCSLHHSTNLQVFPSASHNSTCCFCELSRESHSFQLNLLLPNQLQQISESLSVIMSIGFGLLSTDSLTLSYSIKTLWLPLTQPSNLFMGGLLRNALVPYECLELLMT
ncbi:hypothetical protein ABPG72_019946 [Tetrahymena utriculariae]